VVIAQGRATSHTDTNGYGNSHCEVEKKRLRTVRPASRVTTTYVKKRKSLLCHQLIPFLPLTVSA
jgi:hypothetical protein